MKFSDFYHGWTMRFYKNRAGSQAAGAMAKALLKSYLQPLAAHTVFFKNRMGHPGLILFAVVMVVSLAVVGLLAAWFAPLPERLTTPGSRVVEYADGSPMCVFLSPDEKWRIPVEFEKVDPDYIKALLRYEDKRFYKHPGVDPLAVARAFFQNLVNARVVSGASTITMQLVRLLEPRPRTIQSKVIETLRAVQFELHFEKHEILAYYLQFLPYGKNVEGIESASLAYFGHRPSDLSPHEIALLLCVPQNPASRYPSPRNAEHTKNAIEHVSERLTDAGVFADEERQAIRRLEPPAAIRPFPREALHVAQYLAARYPGMRIKSTIRRDAQAIAENALDDYRQEYSAYGIHNAAVVVIDNKSGEVTAAVGNFDFWDTEHAGQVIGFIAPRSPGSAMKPFIYGLAIDEGLILPGYLVPDIPVHYSGYKPINYDRRYRGLVRFEDALSRSLNVPFVNVLSEIGLAQYLEYLRGAGISSLEPEPGFYGLSIAVGGLDVYLTELANMYAMLGRGGEYQNLKWIRGRRTRTTRVLSPGAAWLTRRTLRLKDRPDFPLRRGQVVTPGRVFWKTGTSAHHRDAWALGGTNEFTAGVWVGNFNGEPSRYLVGADRAGPVLFDILEGLSDKTGGVIADSAPDDLIAVEVCSWSGRLAGLHCPNHEKTLAVRSRLPTGPCPFHVEYWIDTETGYRLNPMCRSGRKVEARVFTILPASLRQWISDAKLQTQAPPPWMPSCQHVSAGAGPRIVRPGKDAIFFMVPGLKAGRQEIPLEAEAGADVGELFWFVDGKFLAQKSAGERVWLEPAPGPHEIRVLDASGRSHAVKIRIMVPG